MTATEQTTLYVLSATSREDWNYGDRVNLYEDGIFLTRERAQRAADIENDRLAERQNKDAATHRARLDRQHAEAVALFEAGLRPNAPLRAAYPEVEPVTAASIAETWGYRVEEITAIA